MKHFAWLYLIDSAWKMYIHFLYEYSTFLFQKKVCWAFISVIHFLDYLCCMYTIYGLMDGWMDGWMGGWMEDSLPAVMIYCISAELHTLDNNKTILMIICTLINDRELEHHKQDMLIIPVLLWNPRFETLSLEESPMFWQNIYTYTILHPVNSFPIPVDTYMYIELKA